MKPGGSIGDDEFIPITEEFITREQLTEYIKRNNGYNYTRNMLFSEFIIDKKVADIGCGHGISSAILSKYAASIDGFDIDKKAIGYAKNLKRKFKLNNTNFYWYDLYNTKRPSNSYDVAMLGDVIEHVDNPFLLLTETRRILNKNGILLLSTPNGMIANGDFRKFHSRYHIMEYTPVELNDMLSVAGFRIVDFYSLTNKNRKNMALRKMAKQMLSKIFGKVPDSVHGISKRMGSINMADDWNINKSSLSSLTEANCFAIIIIASKV